jgi:hypothetical protein
LTYVNALAGAFGLIGCRSAHLMINVMISGFDALELGVRSRASSSNEAATARYAFSNRVALNWATRTMDLTFETVVVAATDAQRSAAHGNP